MNRTKKRISGRVMAAATVVAASLFAVSPITAFAGGLECTCEGKCTEDCIDSDCELCQQDYTLCCGEDTAESEDETEPAEETAEEEQGPLTPDGNLTLVDDYGSSSESGKQFITVVTKSGNYFYIIIDRDDSGTETVHFLNMVDEADLLALMDEDEVNEYIASSDTEDTEETEPAETEPEETTEPEEEEAEPVDVESKNNSKGVLIAVVILAAAGIGVYMYFTKFKNKKPKKETEDPDADYVEEDDSYLDGLADDVDEIMTEDEDSRLIKSDESDSDETDPDENE